MTIDRTIQGVDVTINFDEFGNVEHIEVDMKDLKTLQDNAIDFHNQSEDLVREYFEHEKEQYQDRMYEYSKGY